MQDQDWSTGKVDAESRTYEASTENRGCAECASSPLVSGLPIDEADHGEILRLLIGEGTSAALDIFFEAKDPNVDPMLKLKLIGLASNVGDNVRKAIATRAAHFGDKA